MIDTCKNSPGIYDLYPAAPTPPTKDGLKAPMRKSTKKKRPRPGSVFARAGSVPTVPEIPPAEAPLRIVILHPGPVQRLLVSSVLEIVLRPGELTEEWVFRVPESDSRELAVRILADQGWGLIPPGSTIRTADIARGRGVLGVP